MSQIIIVENIPNERSIKLSVEGQEEVYSIEKAPEATSQLVVRSQKEILQNLSLNSVISNLGNAADLMFVAYNALAGTQVQSKMSGLQKSLLDVSADCITTVTAFEVKSQEVVHYTIQSYKWLFKAKEKLALKQLERCGKVAGEMATEAEKLAGRFEELGNKSQDVLEDSINEENLEHKKKNEMRDKLNEVKANHAHAKTMQQSLEEQYQQINAEYQEAKEREATESQRAFISSLTSSLASAASSGFGSLAGAVNPVTGATKMINSWTNPPTSQALDNQASSETGNLIEKSEKAQSDKHKLEKERDKIEAEIQQKEGILEDTKDNEEKSKLTEELKKLRQNKKDTEVKLTKTDKLLQSLSEGLNQFSEKVAKTGDRAQTAADRAAQQKMEFFKKKNDLAAQKRQTLASIEKYALQIANTKTSISNAEKAVDTLHCAVQALNQIVVSLKDASLFWRSMERYCQRLQKSKFLENLQDFQELDADERIEEYSKQDMMQSAVTNLSRWVALNSVCKEYLEAVNKTYKQVGENIKAAPSIEEAQKQAPLLAKKILASVRQELEILDVKAEEVS